MDASAVNICILLLPSLVTGGAFPSTGTIVGAGVVAGAVGPAIVGALVDVVGA